MKVERRGGPDRAKVSQTYTLKGLQPANGAALVRRYSLTGHRRAHESRRERPFADILKSKQTETAETRSTAAQLRKSFCHRKGIEPTFREGSPRSCAKMWQSEIESRLGRIGVQHEPSR